MPVQEDQILQDVYGGAPDWSAMPASLPFADAQLAEEFFNEVASKNLSDMDACRVTVRFSASTNIGARLHPYGDKQYLVAIPMGLD